MNIQTRKLLVCFVGVDGSGKTTHAKSLSRFLLNKGYSVKYVHAATRPILTYPFLIITRVFGYWKSMKKNAYTDPLDLLASLEVKRALGSLYRCLIFLDYLIINLIRIQIPRLLSSCVICDRYVYDLIIDLALSELHSNSFANLLLLSTSRPGKVFFMQSNEDVLSQRRPDFTEMEIQAKANAYGRLAILLDFETIRTEDQFEKNQEHIRNIILSML